MHLYSGSMWFLPIAPNVLKNKKPTHQGFSSGKWAFLVLN
jgi:hypothetical protein